MVIIATTMLHHAGEPASPEDFGNVGDRIHRSRRGEAGRDFPPCMRRAVNPLCGGNRATRCWNIQLPTSRLRARA